MSLGPVNKSRLGGAMGSLANHLGRAAEKLESKGGLREAAKSGARNATEGLAGLSRRSALTASTYAHEKLSSVAGEFSAAAGGALRPALKSVAGMQAGVHRRADNIADRMKNASASIGNAAHQLRSDLNGAAHVAKHEIRQGLHDLKAELKHEAGAFKQGLGNHLHAAASGGGRPQYGTHTEHPTGNDRPPAPYSGGPQGRYDPRPQPGASSRPSSGAKPQTPPESSGPAEPLTRNDRPPAPYSGGPQGRYDPRPQPGASSKPSSGAKPQTPPESSGPAEPLTRNDRPPAPYSGGPQGRYDPRPQPGASSKPSSGAKPQTPPESSGPAEQPTRNDRPSAPHSGGAQGRYDPRPGAGAQGTGGTSRTNEPRANQKPAGSGTPPRAEAKPTGPASHAEEKPVGRAAGLKLMGLSDKATPHDILGVSADASPAEIRKGSLKQLLKFHPDKNNGSAESTEATKLINNAVEALRKA
jgi:DnaJ domain